MSHFSASALWLACLVLASFVADPSPLGIKLIKNGWWRPTCHDRRLTTTAHSTHHRGYIPVYNAGGWGGGDKWEYPKHIPYIHIQNTFTNSYYNTTKVSTPFWITHGISMYTTLLPLTNSNLIYSITTCSNNVRIFSTSFPILPYLMKSRSTYTTLKNMTKWYICVLAHNMDP